MLVIQRTMSSQIDKLTKQMEMILSSKNTIFIVERCMNSMFQDITLKSEYFVGFEGNHKGKIVGHDTLSIIVIFPLLKIFYL